jgi:hypothetical protein
VATDGNGDEDGLVTFHQMSIKEAVVMGCMWTQVVMGCMVVVL